MNAKTAFRVPRVSICGLVLLVVLTGCAGEIARAPVEQRGVARPSAPVSDTSGLRHHVVVKGDTLYSIAWRYGHDFRKLAKANGIASPYIIYPGQKLALTGKPVASISKRQPPASGKTSARSTSADSTSTASSVAAKPASSVAAKPASSVAAKPASSPAAKPASKDKSTARPKPAAVGSVAWLWPTRGKVVKNFLGEKHKGIDISGKSGDAVNAAAHGEVVYAGSGIVGYGNLLIIKHGETYLSAYGYNRRLLVAEGEKVAAGQRIAEKGDSATNEIKLHFEIRREGRPVDPLKLLPKR
ncbi:MAG: peptidoglycan DD-metalloendopeptidase family protein [Halieaceae bacterium]|nr:peptidoglycan DD-metalloendopeptidase family protein [Halieaceae bacterium]